MNNSFREIFMNFNVVRSIFIPHISLYLRLLEHQEDFSVKKATKVKNLTKYHG